MHFAEKIYHMTNLHMLKSPKRRNPHASKGVNKWVGRVHRSDVV